MVRLSMVNGPRFVVDVDLDVAVDYRCLTRSFNSPAKGQDH